MVRRAKRKIDTDVRMSSWRDEVEQCVHSVVAETRITLDTGLFGQDIIVLALQVADYFLEAKIRGRLVRKCWRRAQEG